MSTNCLNQMRFLQVEVLYNNTHIILWQQCLLSIWPQTMKYFRIIIFGSQYHMGFIYLVCSCLYCIGLNSLWNKIDGNQDSCPIIAHLSWRRIKQIYSRIIILEVNITRGPKPLHVFIVQVWTQFAIRWIKVWFMFGVLAWKRRIEMI